MPEDDEERTKKGCALDNTFVEAMLRYATAAWMSVNVGDDWCASRTGHSRGDAKDVRIDG